ncbi:hypothetical protein P7D43_23030 [Enterococcus avium]|jgi:hypothetical protein|uniref:DUF1642 domain-containing protein n=1 Tax=Enterococcus avium TaxID=33945 RepID=A0AAW8S3S2_ENTAV|nr:hypothetical protein [Enterococcus avium]MDT2405236.1 hypothetical protein [Enterococcus avium]HAQ8926889.1 hypothetical protein [Enterococcus faecium]
MNELYYIESFSKKEIIEKMQNHLDEEEDELENPRSDADDEFVASIKKEVWLKAIQLAKQIEEPEFNDYLCDIKSQIEYLRIHGPGKIKSLRMLQNMVDNMITGCWSSTSIRTQKVKARLAKHWDEDLGDCLWWDFPVEEPPYCGTPLDDDFPKYKTHFTELHIPDEVEEEPKWVVKVGNLYFCGWEDTTAQFVMNTVLGEDESIIKYKNEGTASSVAKNLGGTVEKV